jgi:hypothetical protein
MEIKKGKKSSKFNNIVASRKDFDHWCMTIRGVNKEIMWLSSKQQNKKKSLTKHRKNILKVI